MDIIGHFKHSRKTGALPAGVRLFRAGEPADVMYVLLEGEADVRVGDTIVEIAGPGALLGEMALIDQQVRSATVVTRTRCTVIPIGVAEFDLLVRETPAFARYVMKAMAERLRRMNENLVAAQAADVLQPAPKAPAMREAAGPRGRSH